MDQKFSRAVLVCNNHSGSYDPAVEAQITAQLVAHQLALAHIYRLPEHSVPDAEELSQLGADLLMIWTGDGTINAAADAAAGWDGAILVLPGGTQNLLSKSLHGDRPPVAVLADALGGVSKRHKIPVLESSGRHALINIVAGPATKWADVRETLRQDGVISATRAAPDALDAMRNDDGVAVAGDGTLYPALHLTPTECGIQVHGLLADSIGDVLRHGLAWLAGDFRQGPSDFIVSAEEIRLESRNPIGIEFDGELTEISSPATIRLCRSALDFVTTR